MIIIDDNFLSDIQKKFLDQIFNSRTYNFKFLRDGADSEELNHFCHIIRDLDGEQNSPLQHGLYDILLTFCKKNNIVCEKVFRCAVQVTFNLGENNRSVNHVDHLWDYNHFLLYLNDTTGNTVIMDKDNKNVEKIVEPKKYRGLVFDKRYHHYYFPLSKTRRVIAYTFK